MLINRSNPISLLDNTPLREMLTRTLDFGRIQENIDTGALYAVSVTASGYSSGQSVSFYQGGPGLEAWERTQRVGASTTLNVDLLSLRRAPVHLSGGEVQPRVLRRRLDAPDRADRPRCTSARTGCW